MVEVVLLGIPSGLDHIRPCDLSGRRQGLSGSSPWRNTHISEGLPRAPDGLPIRLSRRSRRRSHRLRRPLPHCLRLRHQIPQFPEKITQEYIYIQMDV